ncbi:MAG TPA: nucleotide exchange factor GrpE [Kofleriaceae bacterium]|nr:nucleotide exchange factor GrpE [Kofleriaceae bacterium]
MAPENGPSEDAVRDQLREERGNIADSPSAADADNGADRDRDDAVAEVEAARSAEARMATESAAAVESADAASDAEAEAAPRDDDPAHLKAERDRYLDLAKRAQADFDNYRKRAAKDAAAAGARAKVGLVRELLPVVDNLERALTSATESDSAIAEGVRLVHADLIGVLERNGIESQEPAGEKFDPTEHEAVSMREEDGAEPGIVLDVVEKGYKLNDTVIRPARVVVSG